MEKLYSILYTTTGLYFAKKVHAIIEKEKGHAVYAEKLPGRFIVNIWRVEVKKIFNETSVAIFKFLYRQKL